MNNKALIVDHESQSASTKSRSTTKQIKLIERLAARGLSREQVGAIVGSNRDFITLLGGNHAIFEEAYIRGALKSVAFAVSKLFEAVKDGNLQAIIFFLSSHGGNWIEKPPTQAAVNAAEERKRLQEEAIRRNDEALERLDKLTPDELRQLDYLMQKMQ